MNDHGVSVSTARKRGRVRVTARALGDKRAACNLGNLRAHACASSLPRIVLVRLVATHRRCRVVRVVTRATELDMLPISTAIDARALTQHPPPFALRARPSSNGRRLRRHAAVTAAALKLTLLFTATRCEFRCDLRCGFQHLRGTHLPNRAGTGKRRRSQMKRCIHIARRNLARDAQACKARMRS